MEPEYKMIDERLQPCWEFKNTNKVKQENIQYKKIKKQFRFKNSTIVTESLCGQYWISANSNWLKRR